MTAQPTLLPRQGTIPEILFTKVQRKPVMPQIIPVMRYTRGRQDLALEIVATQAKVTAKDMGPVIAAITLVELLEP